MIYGDMLSYFPELFRKFDYYEMFPKVSASYTKREKAGTVKGVLQFMKRGELRRENDTLADTEIPTFWTRSTMKVGQFMDIEGEIYKITNKADWLFAGGFNCFVLELMIGNSDAQKPFEKVNIGQNDYD